MAVQRGRHFLQIPGPTNVPDRVLQILGGTGRSALHVARVLDAASA